MFYFKRFLILILGLFLLTSCDCIEGEGPIVSEKRAIDGFDKIELEASANVLIHQSDEFKIEIEGQQNILDILRTRLRGNTLVIEYDKACVMNTRSLEIYISMPVIKEIQIDGSGDVESDDKFTADEFYAGISGSGSIDLEVSAKVIEADINGSGSIYLSGETEEFYSVIRGSGDIKASRLRANMAKAKISGSGNTYIHVIDELRAHINGSGNLNYSGNPTIDFNNNGSGNVRKVR
jgi:hypothetical protein